MLVQVLKMLLYKQYKEISDTLQPVCVQLLIVYDVTVYVHVTKMMIIMF